MKTWYILMTFPNPPETFVANDIRALMRLGVDVSVHALLGPRRDAKDLLRERGLGDLDVSHGTVGNIMRGFAAAVTHPIRAARVTAWAVRQSGRQPVHLVKGLALLPRVFDMFRRLERERPDVVHIYWGHYASIFGWMVLENAPNVIVSISLSAYDLLCGFPGSFNVARRAHLVSTWARVNLPALVARGVQAGSVYLCWQGLDLDKFRDRTIEKIPRRIVTAGRLVASKGMDDVLRAFARVAAEHADTTLVVLGDGSDRRRLEDLASDLGVRHAVTFRGHVAHDEVFEELGRAAVFMLLSRDVGERLPNVVKEAMACRCFVITTDTLGIEELLDDGVHGRLVPQGAWEAAAMWAAEALVNPETAQTVASAARNHVFERFDLLRLMDGLVQKWEACGAPTPDRRRRRLALARSAETSIGIEVQTG